MCLGSSFSLRLDLGTFRAALSLLSSLQRGKVSCHDTWGLNAAALWCHLSGRPPHSAYLMTNEPLLQQLWPVVWTAGSGEVSFPHKRSEVDFCDRPNQQTKAWKWFSDGAGLRKQSRLRTAGQALWSASACVCAFALFTEKMCEFAVSILQLIVDNYCTVCVFNTFIIEIFFLDVTAL